MSDAASTIEVATAHDRVAALEAELAAERELRAQWERKHDLLLGAYQALEQQLELIRRRLFVAKAERVDTTQLEIEFASTLAALDKLACTSGLTDGPGPDGRGDATGAGAKGGARGKHTPKGRRDLRDEDVPEERIVLGDPTADAATEPMGTEEACRMMWRRAGWVRVVTERISIATSLPSTKCRRRMLRKRLRWLGYGPRRCHPR